MKTILQVEDDPNDILFLRHAMKKASISTFVQVVTDGQQAIDYLQGKGIYRDRATFPLPCLVLLDLKLPHVMGLEVLKSIRQMFGATLAVVILSASAEEADIAAAYRLGANAFLTKPSEPGKLEQMVKATTDFWVTQNTLPETFASESPIEGVVSLVRSSPDQVRGDGWKSSRARASRTIKNCLISF